MEEYKLNFLEACEALGEDRCVAIQCEGGCSYGRYKEQDFIGLEGHSAEGMKLTAKEFLGKWKLIGIKPVKHKKIIEDVEWCQQDNEGITFPHGSLFNWRTLVGRPPMTMTLEWEE